MSEQPMKNVLIVEDDAILSFVVKKYVEKMGHKVVGIFSEGKEAINAVKSEKPDIILMDIKIVGEMDGIETMEHIRSFSDVPVIYLTGNSDPKTKERISRTASSSYLFKPVDYSELKNTLEVFFN